MFVKKNFDFLSEYKKRLRNYKGTSQTLAMFEERHAGRWLMVNRVDN